GQDRFEVFVGEVCVIAAEEAADVAARQAGLARKIHLCELALFSLALECNTEVAHGSSRTGRGQVAGAGPPGPAPFRLCEVCIGFTEEFFCPDGCKIWDCHGIAILAWVEKVGTSHGGNYFARFTGHHRRQTVEKTVNNFFQFLFPQTSTGKAKG